MRDGGCGEPVTAERLDEAFRELGRVQSAPDGAPDLLQFRALATAHQYLPLYAAVDRYLRPGQRLLDWGCGNGHVSWTLSRLGFGPVVGFSFLDFPLRDRMDEVFEFVMGDPSEPTMLPFEDGAFDGVLSVGVLEHVRETGGTEIGSLREIHRILRPGGYFICTFLPNRRSWIEWLAERVPGKFSHDYRYSREDIRDLAEEGGFSLEEIRPHGFLPRNSWAKAPPPIRRSSMVAGTWDRLDRFLTDRLSAWVQNHLWIGRRL